MKLTKTSSRTALRDIEELIELGLMEQEEAGGRSTSYRLKKMSNKKPPTKAHYPRLCCREKVFFSSQLGRLQCSYAHKARIGTREVRMLALYSEPRAQHQLCLFWLGRFVDL